MNLVTTASDIKTTPRQVLSTNWVDRDKVLNKDVNMFCWKRALTMDIKQYVRRLIRFNPATIHVFVNNRELASQIHKIRKSWDGLVQHNGDSFWTDVFTLSKDFLTFSLTEEGSLYLGLISDNACTKFHVDGYPLRLFTTYYGQGTEWLTEENVNRSAMGTSNESIVVDHNMIQSMKAGDVSILKGEVFSQTSYTRGIVHRSPEIAHTGEKRIILRVDI